MFYKFVKLMHVYEIFYQALLNILQNIKKKTLTDRERIVVCVDLKSEQSRIKIFKHFFNSNMHIAKF